jgi:hypothetical protein
LGENKNDLDISTNNKIPEAYEKMDASMGYSYETIAETQEMTDINNIPYQKDAQQVGILYYAPFGRDQENLPALEDLIAIGSGECSLNCVTSLII